jgi:hypothetical protein
MAIRPSLLFVGLSVIGLSTGSGYAQALTTKVDVLRALDEPTHDMNRFERVAALARSVGVSDARITIARFSQIMFAGDIEGGRKILPETEKAVAALKPDEVSGTLSEIGQMMPAFKKVLESNDVNRVRMALEKSQKAVEAKSILTDLRQIDSAVDQCALEQRLQIGATVPASEWLKKIRSGSRLRETRADVFGATYGDQIVDQPPKPNAASAAKLAGHVPPNYFDLSSGAQKK